MPVRLKIPRRIQPARIISRPHEMLLFVRNEMRITQKQAAALLGVSHVVYRSWEKLPEEGGRVPNAFALDSIARFIRNNVDEQYIEEVANQTDHD
jgi:DNA-binding XRE family transcriptional regulator